MRPLTVLERKVIKKGIESLSKDNYSLSQNAMDTMTFILRNLNNLYINTHINGTTKQEEVLVLKNTKEGVDTASDIDRS